MEFRKRKNKFFFHLLGMPFIYSVFIPVLVADIWIEIYHRICFPLYGLPFVKRKNYIRIDRYKLKKLSLLEKFNCIYCGYVNGWINYVRVIAGNTEQYWCGIKHEEDSDFVPPEHHKFFENRETYQ